jgi:pimeloyl-ACP methyl ester carboxylesterase
MRMLAHTPIWPLIANRMGLVRGALTRADGWPDRNAVLARYRDKALFAAWAPGVLEDYLADGLVETEDGGVRLACAPAWEAANFAAQGHDPVAAARKAGAPLHVLKAEHGSTVRRAAALARAGAQIDAAPGAGHLMPMERPQETAAWLEHRLAQAFSAA